MLEATPIAFSVAMGLSLAILIFISYSVSAQRTSGFFLNPRNPVDVGQGPDYLELWVWHYLQQRRGWNLLEFRFSSDIWSAPLLFSYS
jgi:hypothetical protein